MRNENGNTSDATDPVQLVLGDVVWRQLDRRHLVVTALLAPVRVSALPPHQTSTYVEAAVVASQHLLQGGGDPQDDGQDETHLTELVVGAGHLLEGREVVRISAVGADALPASRAVRVGGAGDQVAGMARGD